MRISFLFRIFVAKLRKMRKQRYYILVICLWLSMCFSWASQVWNAKNIPVPYLQNSTQYVSDPEHYMSRQALDSANYYLDKLNKECHVQNLFVIVGNVESGDAFRVAQDLGNDYGVGDKKTRRGLVVVIAVNDHKYFIAPGMGLEGELTDVDCDDIARACIVPNMRNQPPSEAVVATSKAIYNKVKNGKTGISDIDDGTIGEDDWFLVVILLLLFFGIPVYMLIHYLLEVFGVIKPDKSQTDKKQRSTRRHDDDIFPPFFFGGGGGRSSGGGFSGGSFGGGSFGGGGAGGSW